MTFALIEKTISTLLLLNVPIGKDIYKKKLILGKIAIIKETIMKVVILKSVIKSNKS